MILAFFLSGISMAMFLAAGVFFLKFWKASNDRFFFYFAVACFLLSFERIALLLMDQLYPNLTIRNEGFSLIYLIRLSAFILIFVAAVQKNRRARIR